MLPPHFKQRHDHREGARDETGQKHADDSDLAATLPVNPVGAKPKAPVHKLWSHAHATIGQLSEIPAYDTKTNTIWVAGVVGVDVLDAGTGALVEHLDVTSFGFVNSVAIHNGLAVVDRSLHQTAANLEAWRSDDTTTVRPSGDASSSAGSRSPSLTMAGMCWWRMKASECRRRYGLHSARPSRHGEHHRCPRPDCGGHGRVYRRSTVRKQPAHEYRHGLRARVHRGRPRWASRLRHPSGRHRDRRVDLRLGLLIRSPVWERNTSVFQETRSIRGTTAPHPFHL